MKSKDRGSTEEFPIREEQVHPTPTHFGHTRREDAASLPALDASHAQ